jgi:hypothetical protein
MDTSSGTGKPVQDLKEVKAGAEEFAQEWMFPRGLDIYKEWYELFDQFKSDFATVAGHPETKWEVLRRDKTDFLKWANGFQDLYIVAGGLNPWNGIFGSRDVISSLMSALEDKNRKITITFGLPIVVDEDEQSNPFVAELVGRAKGFPENLELCKYNHGRPPLHCCIVDGSKFSIEYPHGECHPYRRRIKAEFATREDGAALAGRIIGYYKSKGTAIRDSDTLQQIYLANRTTVSREEKKEKVRRLQQVRELRDKCT